MKPIVLEQIVETGLRGGGVAHEPTLVRLVRSLDNCFQQRISLHLTNVFMKSGLYVPYNDVIVHTIPPDQYEGLLNTIKGSPKTNNGCTGFAIGLHLDNPDSSIADIFPSLTQDAIIIGVYWGER